MGDRWYSIKSLAAGDSRTAEVHIFDVIGEWGLSARSFVRDLNALDVDEIELHINSPGGAVFDGVAIQNALKNHKANVTTYIDGLAGSIASIIAIAGDQVRIADNAYVMIHNPSAFVMGEAKDMLKQAELLEKITEAMARDYSRKMGITAEEARDLMDAETWYLGEEAVQAGFADSTFEGVSIAASFDLSRFASKPPLAAVTQFKSLTSSGGDTPKPSGTFDPKEDPMSDELETATLDADAVDQVVSGNGVKDDGNSANETPDVQAAVNEALANERKRTAELTALGSKFGFAEDAEKSIAEGHTVEEFRAHILSKSPDDWRASLAIKNPSTLPSDEEKTDQGADAVAKIRERRKAMFGTV